MVIMNTKITTSGVLYIPKEIRDCFGRHMSIITNATACVMFPEATDYEDVLRSLEIIESDIEHRISLRDKKRRTDNDRKHKHN